MGRARSRDRVVGVYDAPGGARLVWVVDGRRGARLYPSRAAAEDAARTLTRELAVEDSSLAALAATWVASLDVQESTRATVARHLRYLLGSLGETPVVRLTARALEAQVEQVRPRYAAATLRTMIGRVKELTAWLFKRRFTRSDLGAALVRPRGESRGKPQLRLDEGRRLLSALLSCPRPSSVLLACCLLLGLRRGEALALTARDLDQGGAVVVIERGKTRLASRRLQVPDCLRPRLLDLAAQVPPGERLCPIGHAALVKALRRHLRALDLPLVCVHSLRGLHATAAREAGATGHLVAAQLGHASPSTTEQHYTAPGTSDRLAHRAALRVLTGG
jgi:integrase